MRIDVNTCTGTDKNRLDKLLRGYTVDHLSRDKQGHEHGQDLQAHLPARQHVIGDRVDCLCARGCVACGGRVRVLVVVIIFCLLIVATLQLTHLRDAVVVVVSIADAFKYVALLITRQGRHAFGLAVA